MRRVGFGFLALVSACATVLAGYAMWDHEFLILDYLRGGCHTWIFTSNPCFENPPQPPFEWILFSFLNIGLFALLLGLPILVFFSVAIAVGRNPRFPRQLKYGMGIVVCAYSLVVLVGFFRNYLQEWDSWAGLASVPDDGSSADYVREGALAFGGTAALVVGIAVWLVLRLVRGRPADPNQRVRGAPSGVTGENRGVADYESG